jgi:hypothetical protein
MSPNVEKNDGQSLARPLAFSANALSTADTWTQHETTSTPSVDQSCSDSLQSHPPKQMPRGMTSAFETHHGCHEKRRAKSSGKIRSQLGAQVHWLRHVCPIVLILNFFSCAIRLLVPFITRMQKFKKKCMWETLHETGKQITNSETFYSYTSGRDICHLCVFKQKNLDSKDADVHFHE